MAMVKSTGWTPVMLLLGLMALVSTPALADQGSGMMNDRYRHEMMERYGREGMMGGPGWGMMGPGMMMGGYGPMGMMGGMMGGYGYGPFGMLELSEEQRNKIEAIYRDERKDRLDLMGKMMDEMDKIRELMLADKRDPSAIGKAYEPVFILQRRMIENSVEYMNKMEAVLTKEQREQLRKYRHRGMGYGMMGY
jgi:Spy/CpxP family protein refolding chaperone